MLHPSFNSPRTQKFLLRTIGTYDTRSVRVQKSDAALAAKKELKKVASRHNLSICSQAKNVDELRDTSLIGEISV